jgi:stage V sporulation protein AB
MQLTKTIHFIRHYEWSVMSGVLTGTWVSLRPSHIHLPFFFLIPLGLLAGMFVGMLAAALTEVLNVFPILSKRLGIHESLLILLMAIVFGKVAGSLFHWAIFVK